PVDQAAESSDDRFPLTKLAESAARCSPQDKAEATASSPIVDLARARRAKAAIEQRVTEGDAALQPLVSAIDVEIALAPAEDEIASSNPAQAPDAIFRMCIDRWAMANDDIGHLAPLRDPRLRILEFDYEVAEFTNARTIEDI